MGKIGRAVYSFVSVALISYNYSMVKKSKAKRKTKSISKSKSKSHFQFKLPTLETLKPQGGILLLLVGIAVHIYWAQFVIVA